MYILIFVSCREYSLFSSSIKHLWNIDLHYVPKTKLKKIIIPSRRLDQWISLGICNRRHRRWCGVGLEKMWKIQKSICLILWPCEGKQTWPSLAGTRSLSGDRGAFEAGVGLKLSTLCLQGHAEGNDALCQGVIGIRLFLHEEIR